MVQPSDISIRAERFDSADARRLITALDASLGELYPLEQRFGPNLKAEHLEGGRGRFFVARDRERAIGCGAVRLIDSATAEAKRMYVAPGYRGKGIGARVLAAIEAAAEELGARRLVLETGVYQEAAISLYRSAGFKQIDCWGEYAASSTSVCFEKII